MYLLKPKTHLPRLHLIRTVAPLDTIPLRQEIPISGILWKMEMLEVHDSDPLTRQDPWAIFKMYSSGKAETKSYVTCNVVHGAEAHPELANLVRVVLLASYPGALYTLPVLFSEGGVVVDVEGGALHPGKPLLPLNFGQQ